MTSVRGRVAEQVREAALRLQVLLDRHLAADLRDADDLAVLGLEDREEARSPSRAARCRIVSLDAAAPAERARDEDVEVARAAELHRPLDLRLEVVQLGDGRRRDVGDLVRHRDQRHVLALAEGVARLGADRLRGRRARGGRRRARALDAGVHVRLVVVADVEHVVVALEHPRQAGEADVDACRRRRPGRRRGRRSRPFAFSAAAMPVATAGALPNSEWIHGQLPGATPGRASRRPRGSRSRSRRSAGPPSRASRRRARSARRAPRRSPGRRGGPR